jgi:acetyl/propionyl-CoA carboxylase alpha subunit
MPRSVLGDQHNRPPLVERECSIQRRHQKVVEKRRRRSSAGPAAGPHRGGGRDVSVGYTSAGTVEFLLNEDGSFYLK